MNTRKKTLGLALALAMVSLLGLSGLANAQMMGPGMMGGHGMGMMGGPMSGLTPEKQAVAQKLYNEAVSGGKVVHVDGLAGDELHRVLFAERLVDVFHSAASFDFFHARNA